MCARSTQVGASRARIPGVSAPPSVFISYRSEDVLPVATTLARELERVLAWGRVFLDHRSLEPGTRWPSRLRDEVRQAAVVLLLVGPRWLTLQGADGVRRLDDPDDWVRQEIEGALEAGRFVIPVLVDGTPPLEKRAFRTIPHLATVAELQATTLSTRQWDATFDALVDRLVELGFQRDQAKQGPAEDSAFRPFRSLIPARGHAPFEGRDGLLETLRALLSDGASQEFVVLHGPPGVGKSELAREYARQNLSQYPGGAFYVSVREAGPPVDLAAIGRTALAVTHPGDSTLQDQCIRTLLSLGGAPFLLIYDNAAGPGSVQDWLPPAGVGGHVLVTSIWERWDVRWRCVPVVPLTGPESTRLVSAILGNDVASAATRSLIQFAGGLPVQLVPAAQLLRVSLARRQPPRQVEKIATEARDSFAAPWNHLPPDGRLLLSGAALFHPDRVSRDFIQDAFSRIGLDQQQFEAALDSCLDLSLMTGEEPLRLHPLLARYVVEHVGEVDGEQRRGVLAALHARFVQAGRAVSKCPTDQVAVATLTTFSTDPTQWPSTAYEPGETVFDLRVIGYALVEIGHFGEAQGWFEQAVNEDEQSDEQDHTDHGRLGSSLHQVGVCLSSMGQYATAQRWYERAVAKAEQNNVDGRVDHARLGVSLHQVGFCLSSVRQFAAAQTWFERAVAELEQGDVHGRVNNASLGRSLHQVGFCLSSVEKFADAQKWYGRAVAVKQRGDVRGCVDHTNVGRSFHQVGVCLWSVGQFGEAQKWYERAVAEKERGDVHGRVNHESLGVSVNQVGSCLSSVEEFAEAQKWYKRAVTEKEHGDVHGRVDHESLGTSVHQVGFCLSSVGQFVEAQGWYERAVAEKEQGDVHGRVDHASLGISLHQIGACLSSLGKSADARVWFERAVAEKEQGDVHGRVDRASLAFSRARLVDGQT